MKTSTRAGFWLLYQAWGWWIATAVYAFLIIAKVVTSAHGGLLLLFTIVAEAFNAAVWGAVLGLLVAGALFLLLRRRALGSSGPTKRSIGIAALVGLGAGLALAIFGR